MKKALILALFLVPSFAFASFDVDLHYGSKGDDVTALQEFLTDQGVYTGPISGNFYSLTLSGVRKFQKAQGISPVSGYVGPITRGVINGILADTALETEGDATITPPVVIVPVAPFQGGGGAVSAPATEEVTRVTPTANIKVNGSDGPITVKLDGCIVRFNKTCGHGEVQWTSVGTTACGISAIGNIGWSGNYGLSGTKQGEFATTTTVITLQCSTDTGQVTDTVEVNLQ